jgi:hypothetical protein
MERLKLEETLRGFNTTAKAAESVTSVTTLATSVPTAPKSLAYECAFCEGTTETFNKVI